MPIIGLLATGADRPIIRHSLCPPLRGRRASHIDWSDSCRVVHCRAADRAHLPQWLGRREPFPCRRRHGLDHLPSFCGAGLAHRDLQNSRARRYDRLWPQPQSSSPRRSAWIWHAPITPGDDAILRPVIQSLSAPMAAFKLLNGNLGRCVMKTQRRRSRSAGRSRRPPASFSDQNEVLRAFKEGELDRDVIVVVRFQGPCANGMPELHKLTPPLGVLQDKGFKVALVTDGRMSGASGKVPAAIHLSPEAHGGGPVGKLRDGDTVRDLRAQSGLLTALVDAARYGTGAPKPNRPPPPL